MYGIFTYIWVFFGANVGKYSIHGAYGITNNLGYLVISPDIKATILDMTIQIIQSLKAAAFTESEGHTVETAESEVTCGTFSGARWGQDLRVIQIGFTLW
jgi:hypothetical protein